jgi:hypothetical protein
MLRAALGRAAFVAAVLIVLPPAVAGAEQLAPGDRAQTTVSTPTPDVRDSTAWTEVRSDARSRSTWRVKRDLGVGRASGGERRRAYYVFDTRALRGAHVVAAELNLLQTHAASCRRHRTTVHLAGAVDPHTTWADAPRTGRALDARTSTAGCDGGRSFVGWDVTSAVQRVADRRGREAALLVRASDERSRRAFKRFARRGELAVDYVRTPDVPTDAELESWGAGCGSAAAPVALLPRESVTIHAVLGSPEGSQAELRGVFTMTDLTAGSAPQEVVGEKLRSGTRSQVTWPVESGHTYRWTVSNRRVWQEGGVEHGLDSAPAGPCWFTIQ